MSLNNEDFDLNMNAIEALLALDDVDSVGKNHYTVHTPHSYLFIILFGIDFVYFFLNTVFSISLLQFTVAFNETFYA